MISAGDPKVTGDRRAAQALGLDSAKMKLDEDLRRIEAEKAAEAAKVEAEEALKALAAASPDKGEIAKAKALLDTKEGLRAGRFRTTAGDAIAASKSSVEDRIAVALLGSATDQKGQLAKRLVEEYMRLS